MRDDIVRCAKLGTIGAQKYVKCYEIYEQLWTVDRDEYLKLFLKYGRGLTPEELANMEESEDFRIKEVKPTLDVYREKV